MQASISMLASCKNNFEILHLSSVKPNHMSFLKVFPGHKFYPLAQLSENVPILTCGGISKR